jgi:NADPH-dependent 2,4-dienoyl-CoA reductase/sulfur reductase-like enzyme
MPSLSLLIIGNGGAAIHAVTAARAAGHPGPIHMVSDTPGLAFNPMLSPYYLAGEIPFEQCFSFGKGFYERFDATCHFGSPVGALDPVDREVLLSGGMKLVYDRCLIATGASPLLPPVPGLRTSRYVYTLRTAEETILLHEALSKARNALILGASQVGVKMAEILVRRGMTVTLVDIAGQILPNAAHPECASLLEAHLTSMGVELRMGWTLEEVEDHGEGVYCHFQGNKIIKADLCLVSVGVRPNLEFLERKDVDIDQGILVDDQMRSNLDDLYAAGDVSQGRNLLSGKKEIIGLWGNACYQGRTAGMNMAGRSASYPGTIPGHISTLFGWTFVNLGNLNPQGNDVTILSNRDLSEGPYRLMAFDKGVLVGVNLINGIESAGRFKKALIRKLNWQEHFDPLTHIPSDQEIDRFLADLPVLSSINHLSI